jgi:hypothetical protein
MKLSIQPEVGPTIEDFLASSEMSDSRFQEPTFGIQLTGVQMQCREDLSITKSYCVVANLGHDRRSGVGAGAICDQDCQPKIRPAFLGQVSYLIGECNCALDMRDG